MKQRLRVRIEAELLVEDEHDFSTVSEVLDNFRSYGTAEIVEMKVEDKE